jgi:hypothetical protein
MKALPTRTQGHLVVAAIRVLKHREGKPPTDAEMAELLQLPREEVSHWARGLAAHGALHAIQNPFDVRYEIADHQLVDTLPGDEEVPRLRQEVEAFQQRTKERHSGLDEIFGQDLTKEHKKAMSRLEDELKRFQSRERARAPVDEPGEGDDE